ncbi:MAG: hypothetical protein AABZ08_02195 [Planctomycetota bacterium]
MTTRPEETNSRGGVIGWMKRHPKTTVFLGLVLLLAVGLYLFDAVAKNRLAERIAAIRAKGEPTTLADLLARQRNIPDNENMLEALVKPAEKMGQVTIPEDKSAHLPYLGGAIRVPTGQRWSGQELATAQWYLRQFTAELSSIHAGLKLKDSAHNIAWKEPIVTVPIPELSYLRHAGKVVALEILSAANSDDQKAAEQDILEILPMLQVIDGGESLLSALVHVANHAVVHDCIERTVNLVGLSDLALNRIEASLRVTEHRPDLGTALRSERALFMDSQVFARSAGGAWWSWMSVSVLTTIDLDEGLKLHAMLIEAVQPPYDSVFERLASVEARTQSLPSYCVFTKTVMPSCSRAVVLWLRTIGQRRALRAALASERFRLANKLWPDRLEQLIPAYMDSVPIDPIDGKPIRYSVIPEGIKTWTISGDGHNEDNGGDIQRLEPYSEPTIRPKDFGWVILNPDLRGRECSPPKTTTAPTPTTQPKP